MCCAVREGVKRGMQACCPPASASIVVLPVSPPWGTGTRGHHCGRRIPLPLQLLQLPQERLHLDQRNHLPRHPRPPPPARGRHHQRRRQRVLPRLPRWVGEARVLCCCFAAVLLCPATSPQSVWSGAGNFLRIAWPCLLHRNRTALPACLRSGDLNETFIVGECDEASKLLIKATHDVRTGCRGALVCCALMRSRALLRRPGRPAGCWADALSTADVVHPPTPLAAVCVVVLVGAASNYQKEAQFRALQAASDDAKVGARVGCAAGAPAPAINPSLDVSLRASTACCLLLAVAPCTRRRCHRCGRSGGGARCSWRPPRCWWAMCWYWTPVTSCALTACCSPPAT